MEPFALYLLKSSAILGLFYLVYQLFLKQETFFTANRHFLMIGIVAAFLLPSVTITQYMEAVPIHYGGAIVSDLPEAALPAQEAFPWASLFLWVYGLGIAFLTLKFLVQFLQLWKMIKKNSGVRQNGFHYIQISEPIAPFSFFKTIFYNPSNYSQAELDAILSHERAHAAENHSLDVLLAHILTIVLWFNPLSWLYRRNVKQNLEFLADASAINGIDSLRCYQYTLLKVSGGRYSLPITNHFYSSLIKKRIVMLHKSKSHHLKVLKLGLIVPLLLAFILTFNTKVVAQEPEVTFSIEKVEVLIDKDSEDADLKSDMVFLKEKGVTLKFKGIKRNTAGEIMAISASFKDDTGKSGNYNLSGDTPIEPFVFTLEYEGDYKKMSFGSAASKTFQKKGNSYTKKIVINSEEEDRGKLVDKKKTVIKKVDKEGDEGEAEEMEWFTDDDTNAIQVIIEEIDDLEKIIVNGKEVSREEYEAMEEQHTDGKTIIIKKVRKGDDQFSFITKDSDEEEDIIAMEEGNGTFFLIDTEGDESPLFRIDGKEATEGEAKKLAPDQIESINVYKGAKALEKFGDKAKDGVVEITTKKQE